MRIIHIINSLNKGGAEGNLFRLSERQKKKYKNKIEITIITLIKNGYYENKLKKKGIKILSLNFNQKDKLSFLIKKIIRLRYILRTINPDIIQTWMYHSNFISIFIPKKYHHKIFWNIRHSELNFRISKKLTILISFICGFFSRLIPNKIIYCSEKSIRFHENIHFYSKKKTSLIYNGFSEKIYYPSKKLRTNFRKKNKIKKDPIILGYAGRYAKQKNIETLLISFSKIINNYDNIYLFMAGKNINSENIELKNLVLKYKVNKKVIFLGQQKELLEFYNGVDLLLLSSHSESFPNVIAESMLCSTPVISSNAGCAKKIIGNSGFVLDKNDYISFTKGLNKTLNFYLSKKKNWKIMQRNARIRIKNNFSIERMSEKYIKSWIF